MRALSGAELFGVWERGIAQSPAQRALILLALACGENTVEELERLSVGQRDAHLLALREQMFGSQLASITSCPACAEPLEFQLETADVRAAVATALPAALSLTHAGYNVEFRLPTARDLTSLDPEVSLETNRQFLLQRCVVIAHCGDAEVAAAELPAEVGMAISQHMAAADPQADVQLALACPQCPHAWQATFDIVSYFWTEIQTWAGRLVREVHCLASAYGWHEADVLALSPWRRQAYLELIER
jgi:hypothetical protein